MNAMLLQVFGEVFSYAGPELHDTLGPEDVRGWNSFGHLALAQALEAAFGVELLDGDLTEMDSVGSIKAVLLRRGARG
jgi:acyl carrier protein